MALLRSETNTCSSELAICSLPLFMLLEGYVWNSTITMLCGKLTKPTPAGMILCKPVHVALLKKSVKCCLMTVNLNKDIRKTSYSISRSLNSIQDCPCSFPQRVIWAHYGYAYVNAYHTNKEYMIVEVIL